MLLRGGFLGIVLTAAAGAFAFALWGPPAILPSVTFGLVATTIQLVSTRMVLVARGARFELFAQRWAVGMLLRLAGVVLIPVAALAARAQFQPVAAAVGYLAVLLPLLYWETRLAS